MWRRGRQASSGSTSANNGYGLRQSYGNWYYYTNFEGTYTYTGYYQDLEDTAPAGSWIHLTTTTERRVEQVWKWTLVEDAWRS